MAYWGYFDFMKLLLDRVDNPHVLEIGVHKGQTFLPLLNYLAINHDKFYMSGIDILYREELMVQLKLMASNLTQSQLVDMYTGDSTKTLTNIVNQSKKENESDEILQIYDLILLDGDHNYLTVSKELDILKDLLNDTGIIIVDDYDMEEDEYFGEKEEYLKLGLGNRKEKLQSEKQGVKNAVDDFISKNPNWFIKKLVQFKDFEPVMIGRKDYFEFHDG